MRSRVRREWPLPSRLPEAVDVMFCEFPAELPQCLPWVPGGTDGGLTSSGCERESISWTRPCERAQRRDVKHIVIEKRKIDERKAYHFIRRQP
jgi:hypothetical protein